MSDSTSYGNWPNHFFALRGWLSDLKFDTPEQKERIDTAIKDLNDTYGGNFKVNSPEYLKTLPPAPKPYPLTKNSKMGLNDAIQLKLDHWPMKFTAPRRDNRHQKTLPGLKPSPNGRSLGKTQQLKHPANSFFPRYYRYDALPEEFR